MLTSCMPLICRRRFLTSVAAAAPALLLSRTALASTSSLRRLTFEHTHTGERLAVEYAQGDAYLPEALDAVNRLLRDFRTGEVHDIDKGLLDLLHAVTTLTETRRPFQVISAYRSPATNARLRQQSEGVAGGSLHMQGMAIDIRLADVPLVTLRKAALALGRGGVGFYPSSNFVHVDTGRVRQW